MPDREAIFERIRAALDPLKSDDADRERTPLPDWDAELAICRSHPPFDDPWELFAHKMSEVHGRPVRGLAAAAEILAGEGCKRGFCDPEFAKDPALAGFELETRFEPDRADDHQFGVTRASAAIAETGTVVLRDAESVSRLGALAPWIHVAVVSRERILPTVASAIAEFGDDPYIVFATGPSKTADVEGILIEGVHGPGIQVCCLV